MESKKQLIIIPPMSEALKKLNEVLEGISGDENMEISIIDDLKELSQFLGTTGQCLILASNAKKCATFLQENRSMLAKHHCKTILFTPKEIPAKTLVKLTKIGLTESILENSPPKTFLYKVKLLLRSIKTAKPQEDGDKLVKSLEAKANLEEIEKETKDRKNIEENVLDLGLGKKKNEDSGEVIDYGSNLKGKIKPVEESIDTHWKSNRKKDALTDSGEEEDLSTDSTPDSIETYYKSKRKKTENIEVLPTEEEKSRLERAEEEFLEARRKSNYEDVVDEGSLKSKSLDVKDDQQEEKAKKEKEIELNLIESKKKKSLDAEEETEDIYARPKKIEEEPESQKKSDLKNDADDLGGYLKGKISQIETEEEETPDIEETKEYDNSELEEEDQKNIELDLEAGPKARNKKDEEEDDDNIPHEGEVDHLGDENLDGKGAVDKIQTIMTGSSSGKGKNEEKEDLDDFFARMEKLAEEQEKAKEQGLDLIPAAKEALEKEQSQKAAEAEEDEERKNQENIQLDLITEDKKRENERQDEEDSFRNRESVEKITDKDIKEREKAAQPLDKEIEMKLKSLENDLEKKNKDRIHNAQVDKIDTFYRSGDSAKNKDQNWDNLTDKKTTFELTPGKAKQADGLMEKSAKKDLGEITIDYKKLKQEFEMMAAGLNPDGSSSFGPNFNQSVKNNDDDGSFKVIEVDPKSLDFSISLINMIYAKDVKPKQMYSLIATEMMSSYHCTPVFYTFKTSDMKFTEAYNPFIDLTGNSMPGEKKEWWNEFKKDTATMEHFQSMSMTTWRCPEIKNNDVIWEDVELPTWAEQELKDKYVELIFPYFDGIDRMGMAVVFFPEGIKPQDALGILTTLELARTLFLDTIQRYQVQPKADLTLVEETPVSTETSEKKGLKGMLNGLFGKKKAG